MTQGEDMEIHNITEDVVFSTIKTIFETFQNKGNPDNFCLCKQCEVDIACYVLNRCHPHYIVSNRGATRLMQDTFEWQQLEADIATLINQGLQRVKHNQRPDVLHDTPNTETIKIPKLSYSIPVIMGRIFDGSTFAPLSGVKVELHSNGELVAMKDHNWQNPYTLISNTAGSFTFWPKPIAAETADDHKLFEYSMIVEAPEYDTITHFFKIPVISQIQSTAPFSIERTFKLPDIYMFPPGEDEQNE